MAANFGRTPNRARPPPCTIHRVPDDLRMPWVPRGRRPAMPADILRLFVFARHAESAANAADVLNTNPSQPVALTTRGRTQARALGAQLAGLHVDLAVGTRLLRTQQTIDLALAGRPVPTLIEPGFDEIRAGELDGAPIDAYRPTADQ